MEMHVRDLAACRTLYGEQLSLTEVAHGLGPNGDAVSMFAIGDSILELHEDADAVTEKLPSGEEKGLPGRARVRWALRVLRGRQP